jgi:anti-anti-sigma factor
MSPTLSPDMAAPVSHSPFVNIRFRKGVMVLRPTGPQLGQRESGIVADECRRAISGHGVELRHVVIDLSDVHSMASLGLGLCIELRNAARNQQASCILFGLGPELRDLFRLMKIDRLFTMACSTDDLGKAVAA